VSAGREVERLTLAAQSATLARLEPVLADVLAAARCAEHRLEERRALEPGAFAVAAIEFAARTEG